MVKDATDARGATNAVHFRLAAEADVTEFLEFVDKAAKAGNLSVTSIYKKMNLGQQLRLTQLGFEVNRDPENRSHTISWAQYRNPYGEVTLG